jgi:hypothetical protein
MFSIALGFVALAAGVSAQNTGTTTRYWDCCKTSCAWTGKAPVTAPVGSCDASNNPLSDPDVKSGCDGGTAFAYVSTHFRLLTPGNADGLIAQLRQQQPLGSRRLHRIRICCRQHCGLDGDCLVLPMLRAHFHFRTSLRQEDDCTGDQHWRRPWRKPI